VNVALALVYVQGELRTPVLLGEVATTLMGSHDLFRYHVFRYHARLCYPIVNVVY